MHPLDDNDLEAITAGKELREQAARVIGQAERTLASLEQAGVSLTGAGETVSDRVDRLGQALGVGR
jgi:rRNA processing protein Krr1/Pno1